MTISTDSNDFAAYIGIDWADTKHDVCLQAAFDSTRESTILDHAPERIEQWARALEHRFAGKPIAVCTELNKGPLINALTKYEFLVLFPVNPLTVRRFREAFATSGAKDDPSDAQLLLELLCKHRDHLRRLEQPSAAIRTLEALVEQRRSLVSDKVRLSNRLSGTLKLYFPQVLDWFDDRGTTMFCDFLKRWPTLETAQRARPSTLTRFFHGHRVRSAALIERRIEAIASASPLTTDQAVIACNARFAQTLVLQIKCVLDSIRQYDEAISDCARQHPDYALFDALPGAGPALAPRLLVAFGEQRDRYATAADLQKYAGIAPVTERSGNQCSIRWRWRCPTFLRQTFVEWANKTIQYSFWAKAFYEQKRSQGKGHQAAIRALAFKWIRILFRCWQDRRPYDESVYLTALKERGSPLFKYIAATT